MKKMMITLLVNLVLSQTIFAQEQNNPVSIDLSSADLFFEIKKELEAGNVPTEEDWETLLESRGYRIRMSTKESKERLRRIIEFAFMPKFQKQCDSILEMSLADNLNDWDKVSSKLMMLNFLEMKKNMKVLENFRNSYNFNAVEQKSKAILKNFLKNPIDSLIEFPPISILCQEADAQVKGKNILIDFNVFYQYEQTGVAVKLFAHELFHSYRENFTNKKLLKSYELIRQIDKLENEGIANMIDKTLEIILQQLKDMKYPKILIDSYELAYKNTPRKLQTMDSIACLFIDNKIEKQEFDKKMEEFFMFGGHPYSIYMTNVIRKVGLKNELIEHFYNPIKFIEIYNDAAKENGIFVFSEKFVRFLKELETECTVDSKFIDL